MLCLTLTGKNEKECLQQYHQHKHYVQLIELRMDLLHSPNKETAQSIIKQLEMPVILTCRRPQDGGNWIHGERSRCALLQSCLDIIPDFIEIEDDFKNSGLEKKAQELSVKIIRSCYYLEGLPDDLFAKIVKLKKRGDVAKIAVTPRNIKDVLKIFRVEKELKDVPEKVIVGLGDWGIPTRILYKRTGSLFTFCTFPGKSDASGHLSPEIMYELYQSHKITQSTKIFGIIGRPVMHTSSPMIHNPALKKIGLHAVYVPFLVDDVRTFFQLAELLPVQGFSVTIPHKQHVLPYLGKISREVKLIGSCNTVVKKGGLWKGLNTDFYGFLKPIQEKLEAGIIQKALVIGAGGAARAAVWALRNYRCKVVIINRTDEKAEKLAAETGSEWGSLDDAPAHRGADLIVQTTSAGMSPFEGVDPLPNYLFTGSELVYDLVYKPKVTAFLKRAEQAGCSIIYGMDMLLGQGVLQFESFTGMTFPS
ncbi:MAG: shikimate dehydrogenase [Spirochaetales bacterium]|nr:shikimate dehydrogenase [Spirochaetales bacterium]